MFIFMLQQQHERYVGPAYDPSRDLSPNLPVHSSDSSSMGEGDGATSSTSTTSSSGTHSTTTDCSNNNNSATLGTSSACCRVNTTSGVNNFDYKLPPPQSPPSCKLEEPAVTCGGCGNRIADRFYLLAVDQRWHASCLQCCQCRQTLDGEVTCFSRDGNIYCKKDYYRFVHFILIFHCFIMHIRKSVCFIICNV
jgi:LIM homeobox protein 2/9